MQWDFRLANQPTQISLQTLSLGIVFATFIQLHTTISWHLAARGSIWILSAMGMLQDIDTKTAIALVILLAVALAAWRVRRIAINNRRRKQQQIERYSELRSRM